MLSGSLIREARVRAGLTQAELARRAGTSQSAVARWETGASPPSLERLRGVLAACGLELRIAMEEPDEGQRTLIESRLAVPPERRLEDLTSTVQFLRQGRAAMADALIRKGKAARGTRSSRKENV